MHAHHLSVRTPSLKDAIKAGRSSAQNLQKQHLIRNCLLSAFHLTESVDDNRKASCRENVGSIMLTLTTLKEEYVDRAHKKRAKTQNTSMMSLCQDQVILQGVDTPNLVTRKTYNDVPDRHTVRESLRRNLFSADIHFESQSTESPQFHYTGKVRNYNGHTLQLSQLRAFGTMQHPNRNTQDQVVSDSELFYKRTGAVSVRTETYRSQKVLSAILLFLPRTRGVLNAIPSTHSHRTQYYSFHTNIGLNTIPSSHTQ